MAVTVDLVRYGLAVVETEDVGVFRLRVVAQDPEGIDANIFVFARGVSPTNSDDTVDKFTQVASAADMAEYPVDEPNEDTEFPYYRSDEVILDFRSSADYEYAWTEIQRRARQLCQAINRLDSMTILETVTISS